MGSSNVITRREILKGAGILLGSGLAATRASVEAQETSGIAFRNGQFYNADAKFNVEAAKDAIIKLMEYHKYPVFQGVRERLWVSDYGLGQFTKLGLAALMFINDQENSFMVMDLFLLPNQMLPEHCHLATDKCPAKMEGWTVRHGLSYVYGEGEPAKDTKAVIPDFEKGYVTVFTETILRPGESARLNRKTARHWQFAGSEGAILTEAATFHDDAGVRHTDPNIKFP